MNSESIRDYILALEKENAKLRMQLEYDSDDESVIGSTNTNVDLANHLYEKAHFEKDSRKKESYKTAGDVIKQLPFEVMCGEELQNIKGINKVVIHLINEWLRYR